MCANVTIYWTSIGNYIVCPIKKSDVSNKLTTEISFHQREIQWQCAKHYLCEVFACILIPNTLISIKFPLVKQYPWLQLTANVTCLGQKLNSQKILSKMMTYTYTNWPNLLSSLFLLSDIWSQNYWSDTTMIRVFSLNFWWGGDSKFLVPVGPRRGRSQMGGGNLQKKSDWSQKCPLRPFFAILSMKYSFLRYFWA